MTDDPRTEEILTRLAAATPGDWIAGDGWVYAGPIYDDDPRLTPIGRAAKYADPARQAAEWERVQRDCTLIANAPADLAYLLDRNKALVEENVLLRDRQGSHDLANEGIRQKRRALKAEAERDRLRTVEDAAREIVKSFQSDAVSVFRVKMDALAAALEALDGQS